MATKTKIVPAPDNVDPDVGDGHRRRYVDYLTLDNLEPAARNPKKHREDVIRKGITAFGLVDLPTIDERTGRLVAGHGRRTDLLARRERGETPPDDVAVDDDGNWLIPVVRGWASTDDNEALAVGVTLNQATIAGDWYRQELAELTQDLDAADKALPPLLGFDEHDLEVLLAASRKDTWAPPPASGDLDEQFAPPNDMDANDAADIRAAIARCRELNDPDLTNSQAMGVVARDYLERHR